ncbi:hypothetical protein PCE1_002918 [Barthelona sp. PCE]
MVPTPLEKLKANVYDELFNLLMNRWKTLDKNPYNLVGLTRKERRKRFFVPVTESQAHIVVGLSTNSLSTISTYLHTITSSEIKSLRSAVFCVYDTVSKQDIVVLLTLPGGIYPFCVQCTEGKLQFTELTDLNNDLDFECIQISSFLRDAVRPLPNLFATHFIAMDYHDERNTLSIISENYDRLYKLYGTHLEDVELTPSNSVLTDVLFNFFINTCRYHDAKKFFASVNVKELEYLVAYFHCLVEKTEENMEILLQIIDKIENPAEKIMAYVVSGKVLIYGKFDSFIDRLVESILSLIDDFPTYSEAFAMLANLYILRKKYRSALFFLNRTDVTIDQYMKYLNIYDQKLKGTYCFDETLNKRKEKLFKVFETVEISDGEIESMENSFDTLLNIPTDLVFNESFVENLHIRIPTLTQQFYEDRQKDIDEYECHPFRHFLNHKYYPYTRMYRKLNVLKVLYDTLLRLFLQVHFDDLISLREEIFCNEGVERIDSVATLDLDDDVVPETKLSLHLMFLFEVLVLDARQFTRYRGEAYSYGRKKKRNIEDLHMGLTSVTQESSEESSETEEEDVLTCMQWRELGLLYCRLSSPDVAIGAFKKSINLSHEFPLLVWMDFIQFYATLGSIHDCLKCLDFVCKSYFPTVPFTDVVAFPRHLHRSVIRLVAKFGLQSVRDAQNQIGEPHAFLNWAFHDIVRCKNYGYDE